MPALAATGTGFLLAVLWFDLMFDVQVRRHPAAAAPADALASISAYYRRVTIQARPMGRLVSLAMLVTLGSIVAEIALHSAPALIAWPSLALTLAATGAALVHTVPNAVRIGEARDDHETQARIARSVYRDHLAMIAAIALVAALQVWAAIA